MSQGGFLAMRCALVHPERVRALIQIATQTGTDDPTMLQGYNTMLDAWIANNYRKKSPGRSSTSFSAPTRQAPPPGRKNGAPWITHGDAAIPLAKAQAMQASIPNAELVVVEGGHSINMTNPAPVNAAIEAFLARHRLVS